MIVSISNNNALFKTYFSEEYDLIQTFRHVGGSTPVANDPVDFMSTGFLRKPYIDMWRPDVPIGYSSDEAVPCMINGSYIGANHGHHGAVCLTVKNHGKTLADVGSLWRDENNVEFTLVKIVDDNTLHFISENVGESIHRYEFVKNITGKLTYVGSGCNTAEITDTSEQTVTDLKRAIRHKKRFITAFKDGVPFPVSSEAECDSAQIYEEYEIINPATVAEDLRNKRPVNGYTEYQDLGYYGEPMFLYRVIYRIDENGTLTIEFNHKKLADIHFQRWMGAMYQEKLDVYKGGTKRFIPKTLPFSTPEGEFDFSKGVMLRGAPFPENHNLEKSEWIPDVFPPDRLIDYFKDENGHDRLGLACGYLPIYDGTPENRSSISSCIHIYRTRKAYPTFLNGDVGDVHGVAYKKYFTPQNDNVSSYTVFYENKTYIYVDFHASASLSMNFSGRISLFEKSENASYTIEDSLLTVSASDHGYAVFICE